MRLHYLDFDTSEDADGAVVFDALASVAPDRHQALMAEVAAVLAWAHRTFAGARAPLEDGGEWDYQLDGAREMRVPVALSYDESSGRIAELPGTAGPARHAVGLSIGGTAGFADAFREAFHIG